MLQEGKKYYADLHTCKITQYCYDSEIQQVSVSCTFSPLGEDKKGSTKNFDKDMLQIMIRVGDNSIHIKVDIWKQSESLMTVTQNYAK